MSGDDEPQVDGVDNEYDRELSVAERVYSGVIGVSMIAARVTAIFLRNVEAGPTALIAVGAILIVMAVTGAPIRPARFGDNEVILARRRAQAFQRQAEAVGREATEHALIADLSPADIPDGNNSTGSDSVTDDWSDIGTGEQHSSPARSASNSWGHRENAHRRLRSDPVTFGELEALTDADRTAAVLGAWREIETTLREAQAESFSGEPTNAHRALKWAERQGVLPTAVIRLAHDLRQLRNGVVHSGDLLLTREGARSYVQSARQVIDAIALARAPEVIARNYEIELQAALWKISANMVTHPRGRRGLVDFMTQDHSGGIAVVQVKYITPREGFEFSAAHARRELERVENSGLSGGLLIVTNTPLADSARALNGGEQEFSRKVEVVQWRGLPTTAYSFAPWRGSQRVSPPPDVTRIPTNPSL